MTPPPPLTRAEILELAAVSPVELLWPSQIAKAFGVLPWTVSSWCRKNRIKADRTLGNRYRIEARTAAAVLKRATNIRPGRPAGGKNVEKRAAAALRALGE